MPTKPDYAPWAEHTLAKLREKAAWSCLKNRDKIPYTTDAAGNYLDKAEGNTLNGLSWWTNGFWGGLLWLLYHDTGLDLYRETAQAAEQRMDGCFSPQNALNHDVGFLYMPTAVADYRLTGNAASRGRGLLAANLLAGRYNPAGGFLRAWDGDGAGHDTRGWAIIDCMCNLPLLYWASEQTGDPRFAQIATHHADTVQRYFIRADGSVKHIVEFDPDTGRYLCSHGGQGFGHGSAWARGQGWALNGFVHSYRHTQNAAYLGAARRVAAYCLAHLPESGIIPCDFCQPPQPVVEDDCAAAILACGLLHLADALPAAFSAEAARCRHGAWRILKTLDAQRADWSHDSDAILQRCTAAYHDAAHHFPMIYADYYFAEALYTLRGTDFTIW